MNETQRPTEKDAAVVSLNQRRAKRDESAPSPGAPAITFGMDDDRITFRDQAALDEYVAGAILEHSRYHGGGVDDCSSDPTSPCVRVTRVLPLASTEEDVMTPEEVAAVLEAHEYVLAGSTSGRAPGVCLCGFGRRSDEDETLQDVHRAHVAEVLAALMPEATEAVEWAYQWPDDDSPIEYPNPSTDLTAPARKTHRVMGARIFKRTRTSYAGRVTDWEEDGA